MLDWMKKLFKKEEHQEEKTAVNKEVPKNTESKSKRPRVNHYTEAREAQMASRNSGVKCRFPLVPDDGFDEENVEESTHVEESAYVEEQPLPRVINVERRGPRYVEEPIHTFAPQQVEQEIEPKPFIPKKSVPTQESNRRPFRPTEMISPIFGYKRPSMEKEEVKTEEKRQEDLEISVEGKSVVDAWLEKKGYSLANLSDESFIPSKEREQSFDDDRQQESKKEEKSVVDQWLEKNGYDSERSFIAVEEKEKTDVSPDSRPFATDGSLHKAVGQDNKKEEHALHNGQVVGQEPDVVVLSQDDIGENEESLQNQLQDSIVKNIDTTSMEEIEYKKETEEQLVENTVLTECVIEEAEPAAEVEEEEEAEPAVEVEEEEEVEPALEVKAEEEADIVEATAQVVVEEPAEPQKVVSKVENDICETSLAADEHTKEAVQSFANVLIEEAEEKQEVTVEKPVEKTVEPKREKKRHVPFNVVMLKQDRRKLMERQVAGMKTPQTPVQQVEEVSQRKEQLMQQVVAEPQMEERPTQQVVAEPQMEERAMQQVVAGSQMEERPTQQVVVEPQMEERPTQQVVAEPQMEERPTQQVVVEPEVEERPTQQVVVEPQAEERAMQQVVAGTQVTEKPVQQPEVKVPVANAGVQEKAYVVAKRENDMRNVLQTPPEYTMPPLTLLTIPTQATLDNTEWLDEQKELLDTTFNNFHVGAQVINVSQGPAVTRFEVQPDPGVKVNKITNLSDDIKLSLAAKDIRIEAPIPGKSAIGIEVPNKESKPVFLREILRSPVFTKSESPLTVALGLDISGAPIVTDIRKMPHGLIAGATGSGKSVCINAILTSILYKAKPHEVKLMLIDPKMVELAPYNSVPHLVAPVITDVKAATGALKWAVEEMERRYELFAHAGARDLTRYNTIVSEREVPGETLPYIVIVIDELADLMMVAPGDVEEAICRIAQKARACGIHLLVATQRPSVDVITGLIKSNIPTRIAFTVSSQVDSRTIIDIGGAEKLLGRGDMLFLGNGTSKPVRVQGVYVSDDEIEKTVDHVKKQMKPNYLFKQEDLLAKTEQHEAEDELFFDACQFVVEQGGASTSSVQRKFRIGYNRAARLIEEMEAQGIISEARGTKPRDVLISEDEFAAMQETNV
ncbi:DNA translocase FtsK [Bacillus sp. 166amftsu]|uniref:DNA translocase FtsK n=1 Tax=Bacillus sp. 166amftsu TaxID=1761753 RepID=UPI0008954B9C|nr:DNA translocase FtsK [Bacillus sp. 166amftsu]SDY59404.1 DNA translocase FtsK [Bacillus sp. 166amftsu]